MALRDEKGTPELGASLSMALAAAMISELLLLGRIRVEDGRKKLVHLRDAASTGDELLDEALEKVQVARKPRDLQYWVHKLSGVKDLRHRAALQLCRLGVLLEEEDKVLGIFKRRIYPEADPEPEREILERIRAAILGEGSEVDSRTAVLVSLARATNLLAIHFSRKELREHKPRIERVVNGELVGKATRDAIAAQQAAVLAAAVIPAIVASTAAASH